MILIKNPVIRKTIRWAVLLIIGILVMMPAFVADAGRKYALLSLIIAVLSIFVFYSGYERKNIGSRRAVICAILIALSVIGRFIPMFKPISAITILCAIYLGRECGFMCGSLSALISDFYFGIGPWTPFQMFAWGMIGYIAGIFCRSLKKNRVWLVTFGGLSGVLFSFIMDIWSVLWYNGSLELSLYVTAIVSALPHTMLYCVSNIIFLLVFARPFGEKLERIRVKYGI